MPRRGSAAWVLVIVIITSLIIGSLLFTVIDPVMQTLFGSSLWQSSTTHGQNALSWQKSMWAFIPTGVLIALLLTAWIETRQPT